MFRLRIGRPEPGWAGRASPAAVACGGSAAPVASTDRADLFAVPLAEVAAPGYYELVRNWRIGVALAERLDRPFALVNLGPRKLATRTPGIDTLFKPSRDRIFASLSWTALLDYLAQESELPRWFRDFVVERQLDSRWS